jgi:inosine-uridine nucleoside N-ribohydrolase
MLIGYGVMNNEEKKLFTISHCFIVLIMLLTFFFGLGCKKPLMLTPRPIPVILDTDIGGDIDDIWALSFLLTCPELDVKLVTSDSGDTVAKAHLISKLLQNAGRSDIPVGIGIKRDGTIASSEDWTSDYPGTVHLDGAGAIIETILNSEDRITLIATGPVGNLERVLKREPRIADLTRLVVMAGSIGKQEQGEPTIAENNVKKNIKAAQVVYSADWDVTMAPVDTAGKVVLKGDYYARVRDAGSPMTQMIMEHYRIWNSKHLDLAFDSNQTSSILWDTVAVYLAFDDRYCRLRDIPLRITDDGITQPYPDGKLIHVAMEWKDLDAFFKLLSERISEYKVSPYSDNGDSGCQR